MKTVTIAGVEYLDLHNPRNSCSVGTGNHRLDCALFHVDCNRRREATKTNCTYRLFVDDTEHNRAKYIMFRLEESG